MSTVDDSVQLQERTVVRKGLKALRNEGLIPAVIHNHGQSSLHVMAPVTELSKVYRQAGKHHPLQLHIGEQNFLALIKDVQYDPVKRRMQHVVFQAIRRDEKVEAEVPIRLEGEIPAEKVGLLVLHQLDNIQVEALPQNLPDEFVIDGAKLVELHDKITVADLTAPDGVTILTDAEHPIATVVETRAQVAEEAEEEAAEGEEGAAEGETDNAEETAEDE